MVSDHLRSYIPALSVEDIVTIKLRRENMTCEFCDYPYEHELEVVVEGRRTILWLCGHCEPSRTILRIHQPTNCNMEAKQ